MNAPNSPPEAPIVACIHCGSALNVREIPARGECPSCGGFMEVSVSSFQTATACNEEHPTTTFAARASQLGWIIAAILLGVLLAVMFLTEIRLRIFSTRVDDYEPIRDNCFASWPWSGAPNPSCPVPAAILASIGWDADGHSHALVAPAFIVATHDAPKGNIHFRTTDGKRISRRITETFTYSRDTQGRPFIRLCKLDQPVPISIRPLPVVAPANNTRLPWDVFIIGRQGRIGREFHSFAKIERRFHIASGQITSKGMLIAEPGELLPGQVRLRSGDSGSPALVHTENGWALVAVACAVKTGQAGRGSLLEHIYAMPGPHVAQMRITGAAIRIQPMTPPHPQGQAGISQPGAESNGLVDLR